MTGKFITLEGGEGAGKSTVLATLREALEQAGADVVVTREPGTTQAGEAIRHIVLHPDFHGLCSETELLLMFAARAQLVHERIRPALAAGQWVLSDRYTDASYAYQGGGRGQPVERIAELERWAIGGLRPDLTLLLDVPVEQGLARIGKRTEGTDRIERERIDFFERVRAAYHARANGDLARFRIVDASRPLADVLTDVRRIAAEFVVGRTEPAR